MLNFCYLKVIHFLHHDIIQNLIGDILKNAQKSKYVYLNDVIYNQNKNEAEK